MVYMIDEMLQLEIDVDLFCSKINLNTFNVLEKSYQIYLHVHPSSQIFQLPHQAS